MEISKRTVVDLRRNQGDEGNATQFASEAPGTIDTERDTDLLERFGIRLEDIAGGKAGLGDVTGFNQAHDLRRGTDIRSQSEG